MSSVLAIDHVGIAVDDLDAAVEHHRRTLGVKPILRERVVDQGVEEVLFAAGGSFIQLLGALGPDLRASRRAQEILVRLGYPDPREFPRVTPSVSH